MKEHQFYLANPTVWRTLRSANDIDRIYRKRAHFVNWFTWLTTPFQWIQRRMVEKQLDRVELNDQPPVFILGHWRSGTTHLHYALAHDPQFGVLTNYQAFLFTVAFLSKTWLKFVLSPLMPETRPQDNVKMKPDLPAEEEQPFSNTSVHSGIHSWFFPRNKSYFHKYNLFRGISDAEKAAWQRDYVKCLKYIHLFQGEKPLVLKNPHNTGRVRELLELFPDARFIFIHRNPFDVFLSTRHLYRTAVNTQVFQFMSLRDMEDLVIEYYREPMKKYLDERHLIPPGHLFEIGFDQLEQEGISAIRRIYDELSIPGWGDAEPHIQSYFDDVRGYKKNRFRSLPDETVRRIREEWGFAFDEWGYSRDLN